MVLPTVQNGCVYCTISTVSSVTRNGQEKSPCFKSLELKRKFISHLGQHIFRIRELTVEMVQYLSLKVSHCPVFRTFVLIYLCQCLHQFQLSIDLCRKQLGRTIIFTSKEFSQHCWLLFVFSPQW